MKKAIYFSETKNTRCFITKLNSMGLCSCIDKQGNEFYDWIGNLKKIY